MPLLTAKKQTGTRWWSFGTLGDFAFITRVTDEIVFQKIFCHILLYGMEYVLVSTVSSKVDNFHLSMWVK